MNGEQVTLDELKKGYMKDADYRQKTTEVAERRRGLDTKEQEIATKEAEINEIITSLQTGDQTPAQDPKQVEQLKSLQEEIKSLKGSYYMDKLDSGFEALAKTHKDFKFEKDKNGVYIGKTKSILEFMQRSNNPNMDFAHWKLFGEDERAAGRKEAIEEFKDGNTDFTEGGEGGTTKETEKVAPDEQARRDIVASGWKDPAS